jgi:argininosuccinate lyase
MKGLPMTYNRDMQEDKEQLFDAYDTVAASIEMARVVTESAVLKPTAPAAAAEESWAVATDLAEELSRRGVPFHQAHQIVGRLVLESTRAGKKPSEWSSNDLATFAPEFTRDMVKLLDPREGMKSRTVRGGTAPESVARALEEAETRLAGLRR